MSASTIRSLEADNRNFRRLLDRAQVNHFLGNTGVLEIMESASRSLSLMGLPPFQSLASAKAIIPQIDLEAIQSLASAADLFDATQLDFASQAASRIGREIAAMQSGIAGMSAALALDSVRLQVDALPMRMAIDASWVSVLTENVSLSSGILSDTVAIARLGDSLHPVARRLYAPISAAVDPVVSAHRDYIAHEVERLSAMQTSRGGLAASVNPSTAAHGVTKTARAVLEGRTDGDALFNVDRDFKDLLSERGMPAARRDFEAARLAVAGLKPGWVKTASHHLREAFREVLLVLAPDGEVVRTSEGQVTRKARIHYVIPSSTLAEFTEAAADNWERMLVLLNAEAHNSEEPRLAQTGMFGVVQIVEGTIRVLLDVHDLGDKEDEGDPC